MVEYQGHIPTSNGLHRALVSHILYKVLLLIAKFQHGQAPKYLCEFMSQPLSAHSSSHPLRSADHFDLLVPWFHSSLSQNRAFALVGPALWNDSPPALRSVMLTGDITCVSS